jgi:mannose-6-phosphate isomerase
MADFFKLRNRIKHYEWGSPAYIPELMGLEADGSPWAELWMGSHPGSPSLVSRPYGETTLGELIAENPSLYLGEKIAKKFGCLPFLFKLLAAEKPLSIQAHPNQCLARQGFENENRAGLPPDAPRRNYRDSNHKPEIFCALTPFTGMCGFRSPGEIRRLLSSLPCKGFAPLFEALEIPEPASALRNFLNALFSLSPAVRKEISEFILSAQELVDSGTEHVEWKLMRNFAALHSGDLTSGTYPSLNSSGALPKISGYASFSKNQTLPFIRTRSSSPLLPLPK